MKKRKIIFIIIALIGIISITIGTFLIFSSKKKKKEEENPIIYDLKCEKEMYNFIYKSVIKVTANYSTKDDEILASQIIATITPSEETNEKYLENLYNEYTTLYKNKDGYPTYNLNLSDSLTIEELTDYRKVKNIPDQILRDFIDLPHLDLKQTKSELEKELEDSKFLCK